MFLARHLGRRRFATRIAAGLLAITAAVSAPGTATASGHDRDRRDPAEKIVLTFDVSEDFTKFNPTFVKPTDTQPERGSFFVTEGNLYPAGTIEGDGANFDPRSPGAIGKWFCRGTHLVAASQIPAAEIWVDTAQLYLLARGRNSIVTDGLEGTVTLMRAVTGGSGAYAGYVGEQRQEFLGFNPTGGVNLRVTFILRKAVK